MNSLERFRATLAFEQTDRPLLWECGNWAATIRRWYREGLPQRHGIPAPKLLVQHLHITQDPTQGIAVLLAHRSNLQAITDHPVASQI